MPAEPQASSAKDRSASLYVALACLNQETLSQEERLRRTRALFLKHGLTDPEYVSHVRLFLADTSRSKDLARRIRETCSP